MCLSCFRCKFFSLTETPENYTVVLDEEGFKGKSTPCAHRPEFFPPQFDCSCWHHQFWTVFYSLEYNIRQLDSWNQCTFLEYRKILHEMKQSVSTKQFWQQHFDIWGKVNANKYSDHRENNFSDSDTFDINNFTLGFGKELSWFLLSKH